MTCLHVSLNYTWWNRIILISPTVLNVVVYCSLWAVRRQANLLFSPGSLSGEIPSPWSWRQCTVPSTVPVPQRLSLQSDCSNWGGFRWLTADWLIAQHTLWRGRFKFVLFLQFSTICKLKFEQKLHQRLSACTWSPTPKTYYRQLHLAPVCSANLHRLHSLIPWCPPLSCSATFSRGKSFHTWLYHYSTITEDGSWGRPANFLHLPHHK